MVASAQQDLASIKTKVRRLTALSDTSQLTEADLEERINKFLVTDLPYSIKLDQTQIQYEFFTRPYVDRYTLDIQNYQGVRDPVYIDGYQGSLYKSLDSFYAAWPIANTDLVLGTGDGSTLSFSLSFGGSPVLPGSIVIGYKDTSGSYVAIDDDGAGTLRFVATDSEGNKTYTKAGTITYSDGSGTLTLTDRIPANDEYINGSYREVSPSRPSAVLFWNNEFVVRPVPDKVYSVTALIYKTPAQLLADDASPLLKQWCDYISYGVAIEILSEYQDFNSVANLTPMFKQQESMVLERQATEEIGVATGTIYNSVQRLPNGWPGGW